MDVINREPKIFIICGKARHGKDTTALILKKIYEEKQQKVLNISYGSAIKEYAKKVSDWDGSEETKPRTLLQQLGTDVIRKQISQMFFVDRLMNDIKVYSYYFDILTISDARFKVEVDTPKDLFPNVVAIKVVRPNFDNGLSLEQQNHPSEIDLDDYNRYDYTIINDGTIEDLEEKLRKLVGELDEH